MEIKARVASLAQYLAPSSGNLAQIASAIGAPAGAMSADGLSLALPADQGAVGVRDSGTGPIWQWMAQGASLPQRSGS